MVLPEQEHRGFCALRHHAFQAYVRVNATVRDSYIGCLFFAPRGYEKNGPNQTSDKMGHVGAKVGAELTI